MTQSNKNTIQSFQEFWAVYPRRISRKAALVQFEKAIRHTPAETIIEGAKRYAAKITRDETEARFVCHATTWLNQERWDDEEELNIPKQEYVSPEESRRRARLKGFYEIGYWLDEWGDKPQSNVVKLERTA